MAKQVTATAAEEPGVKVLTAEDILAADDIKVEQLEVPEWGGVVYIKAMSAEAGAGLQDLTGEDRKNSAPKIASLCLCDADGNLLFSERQVVALRKKSMSAFMRIQRAVMRINGIRDEDKGTAKNA